MQQNITSHIKKGLLIAAVIIVFNVIAQIAYFVISPWFNYTTILVFIILIVIAVLHFKKQANETAFGVLLTHGFKTAAVATCIIFLYAVIAYYFVFPGYIDELLQKGIEQAKAQGKSLKEIESEMSIARKVLINSLLSGTVMLHLITGVLGALAGAGIGSRLKNKSV